MIKKVYRSQKVVFLFCIMVGIVCGEVPDILHQYAKVRPELIGLMGLDVPVAFHSGPEVTYPRYIKNRVSLHAALSPDHPKTSIDLAYAFQYGALVKFSGDVHDVYHHHLFEVLSQHYAQNYLACLSQEEQKSCLEELWEIAPRLCDMIDDCRDIIINGGDNSVLANRICRYYIMKNRQESAIIGLLDSIARHASSLFPLARPTHLVCFDRELDRLKEQLGIESRYLKFVPSDLMISRSSCDGSVISREAFTRAEFSRQNLLAHAIKTVGSYAFDSAMKKLHQTLIRTFVPDNALASKVRVITLASPYDVHYLAIACALLHHEDWGKEEIVPLVAQILITDEEIDQGTKRASHGDHVAATAPSGRCIQRGTKLEGLPVDVASVSIFTVRDHLTGTCIPYETIAKKVTAATVAAIHHNQQVVIQVAHATNTGQGIPDVSFLTKLKRQYPHKVLIIIDAHQSRCTRHAITEWLDQGFFVLISGSFFFTGPPSTSALLIPEQEADVLEEASLAQVPRGLGDYIASYDVDERLTGLRDALPSWEHYDLFLRWQAAFFEIENYFSFDSSSRYYCANRWFKQIKEELAAYGPYLQLFPICDKHEMAPGRSLIGGCTTIAPFTVHYVDGEEKRGQALDMPALIKMYNLLTEDITPLLPPTLTDNESWAAKQRFLIGRPVSIATDSSPYGVLRLALSAPTVVQFAKAGAEERDALFMQHRVQNTWLFTKIMLILKHLFL